MINKKSLSKILTSLLFIGGSINAKPVVLKEKLVRLEHLKKNIVVHYVFDEEKKKPEIKFPDSDLTLPEFQRLKLKNKKERWKKFGNLSPRLIKKMGKNENIKIRLKLKLNEVPTLNKYEASDAELINNAKEKINANPIVDLETFLIKNSIKKYKILNKSTAIIHIKSKNLNKIAKAPEVAFADLFVKSKKSVSATHPSFPTCPDMDSIPLADAISHGALQPAMSGNGSGVNAAIMEWGLGTTANDFKTCLTSTFPSLSFDPNWNSDLKDNYQGHNQASLEALARTAQGVKLFNWLIPDNNRTEYAKWPDSLNKYDINVSSYSGHHTHNETYLSESQFNIDYAATHWPYTTTLHCTGNNHNLRSIGQNYNGIIVGLGEYDISSMAFKDDGNVTRWKNPEALLQPTNCISGNCEGQRELPHLVAAISPSTGGCGHPVVGLNLSCTRKNQDGTGDIATRVGAGTSTSTPVVAGIVSNLMSSRGFKRYPEVMRSVLMATANSVPSIRDRKSVV